MNILVFKTNVSHKKKIMDLAPILDTMEGVIDWNFDLHDCDNILRVVANAILPNQIESQILQAGYYCEELE